MIAGLLMRHYKNYENLRFIPLLNNDEHLFTVYIGNNGVGKSAILEALDVVMNERRVWNVTQGQKKTEAFICPLFLIPKTKIQSNKRNDIEIVSKYFWESTPGNPTSQAAKEFIDYRDRLKKYEKSHYLVLIGISYDTPGAFFSSSFDSTVKKLLGNDKDEQNDRANHLKNMILSLYSYLYIPVEESPTELLKLQNDTMQKLLNKDVQKEIERLLRVKQDKASIVSQINKNLDSFISDVNKVISQIDPDYSFAPEGNSKKKLTAKDIRAKIIEAFFPLRALKKGARRVDLLSSGEQRRAIIDVAYSSLMANNNGKTDKKTDKFIILAIDEPEISMHISNCFSQFSRLEELSKIGVQVILTTHWYGYLPIAQNGTMHYIEQQEGQPNLRSFNLYNLMELRRNYPDDVELKSMFDLASSLVTYMRREKRQKWIFCEGTDDKIYLQTMLNQYNDLHIIPLGGCGNVVKLYQILVGFMTEKAEKAKANALFLIDTDANRVSIQDAFRFSSEKTTINLKRLQIVNDEIKLLDPSAAGTYSQTEMEDCLNPKIYYQAIKKAISQTKNNSLKNTFKKYEFVANAQRSIIRGDESCIRPIDVKYIPKKQQIVDFVEDDGNKVIIAKTYSEICKNEKGVEHPLADLIAANLGLE